ncbi:MAG: BsuPI-related putative proteinase inhibitor [Armatimonadota bacterium]|jgi:hypothetical protein
MGGKAAVVIVAILINGRPVSLTTPAFIHEGHVIGPVRDLFQQMGATVRWDEETRRVGIAAGERRVELDPAAGMARADGRVVPLRAAPLRRGSTIFAPVGSLAEALGADVRWKPGEKTLLVDLPLPEPGPDATVAIGAILAAPPQYDGLPVRIEGEYRGWAGDPFSFATKHGPPLTRSDWVLRDATGHIYCSADVQPDSEIPLSPRSQNGRRIHVTGVCRISRSGVPYIEPTAVTTPRGLAGLTCTISTDKYVYKPGESVRITLSLGNPLPEPMTLQRPSTQPYELLVRTEEGTLVWEWSRGRAFASVVSSVRLEPGSLAHFAETWDQEANVPGMALSVPGRYRVLGRIGPEIESYPATMEIVR